MTIAPDESHESENRTSSSGTSSAQESSAPIASTFPNDTPVRRKRPQRRSTSHLKAVPETLALREQIKTTAEQYAFTLDKSRPFNKTELEQHGHTLLTELDLPEKYLGFAMVLIGNFFWKQQFMAIPFNRRMLLLPHCLKHAEGCPAEYNQLGLDCETCGACSIADYKTRAEQLGYKVLVAEGSPVVLKIIISGQIDGILGVACLNVLEKAIDKVLLAGVPSYAVPLHSGDCRNTTLDESWVWDVLEKYEPLPKPPTNGYLPLMRAANRLFDDDFSHLLPRVRSRTPQTARAPLGKTETIAYNWLEHGGKRFRPFITLATYDALSGARGLSAPLGDDRPPKFSDAVGRVAIAIEAFHKASLIHDDIQDDDQFRYGQETLHHRHGVGMAINIGDYLIGLGYRLVNSTRNDIDPAASADIVDRMAAAHLKLCDGQGAEMAWQASGRLDITPLDALKIYALKTAPAFEAALYSGLRLAGPTDEYDALIPLFARQVGVGFQILNDLKDWQEDDNNKLVAGQDALSLRPTVLLALALQVADQSQRAVLERNLSGTEPDGLRIGRLRRIFRECRVFEQAESLVEKSRARAEALADDVRSDELRQLLYFLIDTILASDEPVPIDPAVLVSLPISAG